jgi:hypothetical protein
MVEVMKSRGRPETSGAGDDTAMPLRPFQTVRIKTLLREMSEYDPTGDNQRLPRVGDTGTIVEIHTPPAGQIDYTVEFSNADESRTWIADFITEELEAVEAEFNRTEHRSETARVASHSPEPQDAGVREDDEDASDWRLSLSIAVGVLLCVVLLCGALFGVFYLWPPAAAAGAGLRMAAIGVGFVMAGRLLTGEGVVDSMITAAITGILFFILGAVSWHAWTAI